MDKPTTPEVAGLSPATGRRGVMCKMAGIVSRHGKASLAIIVVLTIIVVWMYVYYHGFLKFGPYSKNVARASKKKKPKGQVEEDDDGGRRSKKDRGDDETEKLIESINQGS
jgi:hypothetical protein